MFGRKNVRSTKSILPMVVRMAELDRPISTHSISFWFIFPSKGSLSTCSMTWRSEPFIRNQRVPKQEDTSKYRTRSWSRYLKALKRLLLDTIPWFVSRSIDDLVALVTSSLFSKKERRSGRSLDSSVKPAEPEVGRMEKRQHNTWTFLNYRLGTD